MLNQAVSFLNSLIWSQWLVGLCLVVGLFFSIYLRFPQVRHVRDMWSYLFGGQSPVKGLSSFQAFALAVSGRVGTGNIAGVATAIAMGGPGAVFWMWLIAFLGAGSAFAEAALAQIYKEESDGFFRGGPAHYIARGLGQKWYAVIFAIATIVATGFCLPGIQANSIATTSEEAFGMPSWGSGLLVAVLLGLIIFGGVKRIGRAAQYLVPFMAAGYVIVALVVVGAHASEVPAMLWHIVESAVGVDSVFGGILGSAIANGVKRGIYSNEAGQGTAPIAAAAADVDHPAQQGLVQAFSVYFDTWFVCTATALMILVTGQYNVVNPEGGFIVEALPGVEAGPVFTQMAIDSVLPGVGSAFVAIALFFFAFTTLMAYYYYAETNLAFLSPKGKTGHLIRFGLRAVFLVVVVFGAVKSAKFAWALGDIGVGLMAWLNLIAIVLLARPAIACLRDFEALQKAGGSVRFVASRIGVKNVDAWAIDEADQG
jgi:AGCS family alanine or glycine:cation symporter